MSSNMAKILQEIPKRTINEWFENLPAKDEPKKMKEMRVKCGVALSTVYNWRNGKTPRREYWETIQKVAGKEVKIIFTL